MFEVTVTPEFESWFRALAPSAAEHVAAALDLLESTGPSLDGVKASRLLLWYDGTFHIRPATVLDTERLAGLSEATDELRRLVFWYQEAMRWLDSPKFLARLAELDPETARAALSGIERVRGCVHIARNWGPYLRGLWPKVPEATQRLPGSGEAELVALSRIGAAPVPPRRDSVKDALLELLTLMGLDLEDAPEAPSGLRELTISTTTPKLRVIVGIDVPKKRILAILGEPLNRAYYGDSVRLCELRWREFCQSGAVEVEARHFNA